MRLETLRRLHAPEDPNGPPLMLVIAGTEATDERDGDVYTGTAQIGTHGPYAIRDGVLDLIGSHEFAVSPAQRSNFFWPTSSFYEQVWRTRSLSLLAGEAFSVERELVLLNRWVRPERGGLYIDIGTSHGLYARDLAHEFHRHGTTGTVLAIDIAPAMLRRAGELIAQKGYTTIDRARARAQALPIANGDAAGVVNGGTFNEMGAQADALHETRRVLAPDGVAFTMSLTAARTRIGTAVQSALQGGLGIIFPTVTDTNALYDAAGLTITDQEQHGIVLLTRAVPREPGK